MIRVAQAIQYLSADFQPTRRQTEEGVAALTRALAPFELTKAEKLQVVNLAPTEPVELYVVSTSLFTPFPIFATLFFFLLVLPTRLPLLLLRLPKAL
jgi:hypothetical protein